MIEHQAGLCGVYWFFAGKAKYDCAITAEVIVLQTARSIVPLVRRRCAQGPRQQRKAGTLAYLSLRVLQPRAVVPLTVECCSLSVLRNCSQVSRRGGLSHPSSPT